MYVSGRFKIGRERKGKENSRETAMAYVSFHIPAAFFLFFFFLPDAPQLNSLKVPENTELLICFGGSVFLIVVIVAAVIGWLVLPLCMCFVCLFSVLGNSPFSYPWVSLVRRQAFLRCFNCFFFFFCYPMCKLSMCMCFFFFPSLLTL